MRKFLIAVVGALFLALSPAVALADCYPIAQAQENVKAWDIDAKWEYLTEGPTFTKLVAWAETQNKSLPNVKGAWISYATSSTGTKMVLWALTVDESCAEMATYQKQTQAQFDQIVGGQL